MKTTAVSQASMKNSDTCRAFWTMSLLLLLLLPLPLMATEAGAAKITFEPNELTATVAPGEVVKVPVEVSLIDTTAADSYASFYVVSDDGTLDPAWINSHFFVDLDSPNTKRQMLFQVNVPADAKGGKYKRVFKTLWVNSNEQVATTDLVINIEVSEPFACNLAPEFKEISSAEETINVRNNKEVAIDLSGSVSSPDGCGTVNAWFELTDEYGEMTSTEPEPLALNDDGAFTVTIPMVASRKGDDEDGRLYTVKFFAENEAGVNIEIPEISVVVLHDNDKKTGHESKMRDHDSKKKGHDSKERGHEKDHVSKK